MMSRYQSSKRPLLILGAILVGITLSCLVLKSMLSASIDNAFFEMRKRILSSVFEAVVGGKTQ